MKERERKPEELLSSNNVTVTIRSISNVTVSIADAMSQSVNANDTYCPSRSASRCAWKST